MLNSDKLYQIIDAYDVISKQELSNRVKRTVKRHIRQTEYFDLIKDGSYVKVISVITGKSVATISAYLSTYDKSGIYKNKFPLIHLAKIADAFSSGLEYILGLTENDTSTNTAKEYVDLYERYKNTDKLVVASNIRILKSNGVNGICTNLDVGKVLGISDNAVKNNLSTGKMAEKNRFTILQLYKLADAYDVDVERFFEEH